MNTLPLITAAILAALAVDLGDIDLSATDQVQEGTYVVPPGSFSFACLTPPRIVVSEPQGVGPDWYLETYSAEVRLWAPVTNSTTGNRAQRARRIASEAQQVLDNLRAAASGSALQRCVYWRVSETTPDPAGATSLPNWAHAVLTLEFTFRRQSGTGV